MANPMEKINDMLRAPSKKVVAGIWTDEKTLVAAARKAREHGIDKVEAISPYPMHDIDGGGHDRAPSGAPIFVPSFGAQGNKSSRTLPNAYS